jgi:hypothetical protein
MDWSDIITFSLIGAIFWALTDWFSIELPPLNNFWLFEVGVVQLDSFYHSIVTRLWLIANFIIYFKHGVIFRIIMCKHVRNV